MKIRLDQITIDRTLQRRLTTDNQLIADIAEDLKAGGALWQPPDLMSDGTKTWVVDGFHRCDGAALAGVDEIEANVLRGTYEAARLASYAANKQHDRAGRRRTNAEKRKITQDAVADPETAPMSARLLADHIGVSHTAVANERKRRSGTDPLDPAPKIEVTVPLFDAALAAAILIRDLGIDYCKAVVIEAQKILWPGE